jgi:outer membrane protein TolC
MKIMKQDIFRAAILFLLLPPCLTSIAPAAEPLPLKRAVQLALANSTGAHMAAADVQRAQSAYRELHASYIPQFTVGSGLGASWGFPLSLEGAAPSLVNLNASSAVFNPALREFLRAAKTDLEATSDQSKDQRSQVIQDTVLSYMELSKWEQRIIRLREEEAAANQMEESVTERVKEGIDSPLDRSKARLSAARVRLRLAEAQGSADVLRDHLARLTGLVASSIETTGDSVPAFPEVKQEDNLSARAEKENPAVQAAAERARAQYLRAKGEHKGFWPTLDFATQYARLAKYNNYDAFFKTFEPNNATIGGVIRFPFLNFAQRARAKAADADALKAQKQAEAVKNQVSEQTLKLQRLVQQMEAAEEVARLESEVANANLESVHTRMESGTAGLHDLDAARSQATADYIVLQDTEFELQRARIGLLRSTGDLEKWALEESAVDGSLALTGDEKIVFLLDVNKLH